MFRKFCEFVERYNLLDKEEIVFLNSGGKDATFGLDMLQKYIKLKSLDIKIRCILVMYPQHVYLDCDENFSSEFYSYIGYWKNRGIDIEYYVPNKCINEENALTCSLCKQSRKDILDKLLDEYLVSEKRITILTGYTLFDAMAYTEEILLYTNYMEKTNFMDFDEIQKKRLLNCLHKILPKEILPNGNSIVRPLLCFRENDIKQYLDKNHINYIKKPCVVAQYKHKRLYFESLKILEETNNVSYEMLINFLLKNGIKFPADFEDLENYQFFIDC